jgi:outer membrane protein, multidrug efflux system
MRRVYAVTVACILLAGCKVGPDYHRPAIETPEAFAHEPANVTATADVEWWKLFGDPVLNQLIAEALANNKNIKIAAANVEQASAVLISTRSPLFPQINYQGNASRNRVSELGPSALPAGVHNPIDSYQLLAGASWEVDLWGRIRRMTESAQANLFATQEARRGVILSMLASIATNYLVLRGLDEQLAVAQRTEANYAHSLRSMELKYQYGRVSQMNVDQARARYETAATQIPQIQNNISVLENAISILLGRNPGEIVRGKNIFELTLPAIPGGLPSQLLERRPDILQSEQELAAANALIGAAKAQYFPSISLTAATGYASLELSNLFKGPARTWNYAGSVTGPIFTGGLIYGQVKQAKAAEQAAQLSYEAAVQSAFADVDNALISQQQLATQLEAQERLVNALKSYTQFSQYLYEGGREPYSTVLQAEEDLFPAELNWAMERADLYVGIVSIYKAMGGGWIEDADARIN